MNSLPSLPPLPSVGSGRDLRCPTGVFEYYLESSRLEWSEAMYEIHGYTPGSTTPTLELGIAHVEETERPQAYELWDTLLTDGGPIAGYHTIIDTQGHRHRVLTVADQTTDQGALVGIRGYFTDITGPIYDDTHHLARETITRSSNDRAEIEQAKGLIMAVQSLTADQAFYLLSEHSHTTGEPITDIAAGLINASHDHVLLAAAVHHILPTPTTPTPPSTNS